MYINNVLFRSTNNGRIVVEAVVDHEIGFLFTYNPEAFNFNASEFIGLTPIEAILLADNKKFSN